MNKRKTKQQKKLADLRRHQTLQRSTPSVSLSDLPSQKKSVTYQISPSPTTNATFTHAYLTSDLKKTGHVTFIVLAAQILLYYLLKNHILTLPNVSY